MLLSVVLVNLVVRLSSSVTIKLDLIGTMAAKEVSIRLVASN